MFIFLWTHKLFPSPSSFSVGHSFLNLLQFPDISSILNYPEVYVIYMLGAATQWQSLHKGNQIHKMSGGEDSLDKGPAVCPIALFSYV